MTKITTMTSTAVRHRPMDARIQNLRPRTQGQFICGILSLNLVLLVVIICNDCTDIYMARASTVDHGQLDLGLAHGGGVVESQLGQQSELMEQILNDDVRKDFELSVKAMNTMATELDQFVSREKLTEDVGKGTKLMSYWVRSKGGSEKIILITEFNFILANFWGTFLPLVKVIIEDRPNNLGPNDLDFRCKRGQELMKLKAMSEHSSLYTIYLDIFFSELNKHCLIRKLALIKLNGVSPSLLVKQFVEIYLDLPTSRSPIQELLAGRAMEFDPNAALARHGTLPQTARLVFDPRTAFSPGSDPDSYDELIQQFYADCQAHTAALGAIWGDLDTMSSFLSTQTNNLVQLNEIVKLIAPQLVYGSVCSQLMEMPR